MWSGRQHSCIHRREEVGPRRAGLPSPLRCGGRALLRWGGGECSRARPPDVGRYRGRGWGRRSAGISRCPATVDGRSGSRERAASFLGSSRRGAVDSIPVATDVRRWARAERAFPPPFPCGRALLRWGGGECSRARPRDLGRYRGGGGEDQAALVSHDRLGGEQLAPTRPQLVARRLDHFRRIRRPLRLHLVRRER